MRAAVNLIIETGRLVPDDPSLTNGLTADDGTGEIFSPIPMCIECSEVER